MKNQKPVTYQRIASCGPILFAQILAEDPEGKKTILNYELLELNRAITNTRKEAEKARKPEDKAFWLGEMTTYETALAALRAAKVIP